VTWTNPFDGSDVVSDTVYVQPADEIPPTVSSLSPVDGATAVGVNDDLVITFSEVVDVETDSIWIRRSSDNSLFEGIELPNTGVTGTGTNTITIDPAGTFISETEYYVQISVDAFDDTASNSYAGISDDTSWSFVTNAVPVAGYTADNVIPSAQVSQSVDGNGIVTVIFRARDAESDPVTLENFWYSDNGGSNWYAPDNADASEALAGGWPDNGGSMFTSATDWTGTEHSFTFNTKHADVDSSHSLNSADISNFRIAFRVNDGMASSEYAYSVNRILDNAPPLVSAAVHFESAPVSGTSITLDAAFTETNPDANTFYYDLNNTGYDAGTAGQTDIADPAPQGITVAAANGDDYFTAVKCVHVDDYGNTNFSEDTANVYVKPYTPDAPVVSNPTVSTVDVALDTHASAAPGLEYAIFITPAVYGNNWVQADGSVGVSEAWQTAAAWGTKIVTGLSSPVSQYSFQVKSRNSVDNATESALSSGGSITNNVPVAGYATDNVIPSDQVSQSIDGNGIVTITFRAKDFQSDLVTLAYFYYSDNGGSNWYRPVNFDASEALDGGWPDNSGSKFTSAADWTGTEHSFTFNTKHADVENSHSLSDADVSNFQVAFKVSDGIIYSGYAFSVNQILDNAPPLVSTAVHFEVSPVSGSSVTLDAAFTETNPASNTYYYNLNAAGYDGGTLGDGNIADPGAQAITVAVNGDDYFSAVKCIHVDDYGNTVISEDAASVYVKPYTPEAPAVIAPTVSTVDVAMNAHVSAASGLDYAIYVTPAVGGSNWIQADGSVGPGEVWWTIAEWDTITVTGLSSPVSQYSFQVKSRNSRDGFTESDLSIGGSTTNTAPVAGYATDNVIPSEQVSQSTDGNGIVSVTFRVKDAQGDLVALEGFEYSDDGGSNWYAPDNGDASEALAGGWPDNSGSKFSSAMDWSGTTHSFSFNTRHADVESPHSLSSADIGNFRIRFKANDSLDISAYAVSENQVLDNVSPLVSEAIHFENPPVSGTSIILDAAFIETNPDSNTYYYNLNDTGYAAGILGDINTSDPSARAITLGEINGDDYFSARTLMITGIR
jgi:hypothetical protein